MTTAEALGRADRHEAADGIARRAARGSASNGALMRVFPVAVAFLTADEPTTIRAALDQAALTHPPASGWGAAIAAALMRRLLLGEDAFTAIPGLLAVVPPELVGPFAEVLDPTWAPGPADLPNGTVWTCLAQAVWAVRHATSFEDAVVRAIDLGDDTDTVATVAGALAGARFGVQAIPSRWRTYVHGKVDAVAGTIRYSDGDLQDLTRRLLGGSARPETRPEPPKQPVEVAPGLHAADLLGAAGVPTDWAVVSLCRTYGRFAGHAVRREVYLRDQEGAANIGLGHAVSDAVDGIDALLADGHDVVVHCHGGRSRTALVLKAWGMRRYGMTERQAHEWLLERWPETRDWTSTFNEFLRNEWAAQS